MKFYVRNVVQIANTSFRKWEKIGSKEKCYYETWIFNRAILIFKLQNKFYSCKLCCYKFVEPYIDLLCLQLMHVQGPFPFKIVMYYKDIVRKFETQG